MFLLTADSQDSTDEPSQGNPSVLSPVWNLTFLNAHLWLCFTCLSAETAEDDESAG